MKKSLFYDEAVRFLKKEIENENIKKGGMARRKSGLQVVSKSEK